MSLKKLFVLLAVAAAVTIPGRAELLTFDEAFFGDVISPDDPLTTYSLANGVTLTFENLTYWWPQGGGPFADAGIAYGSGDTAAISFSKPVFVPSLWVGASGDGDFADDRIKGSLLGAVQYDIASPVTSTGSGSWKEISGGAGLPVDRIELGGNFLEGWIAQAEINAVPEPSSLALALLGIGALLLRRRT